MRYPLGLVLDSARYLASRKLRGGKKIPLVLTLDPLGGCSSAHGAEATEPSGALSVEQCLAAMKECDTPVVYIRGKEPLEYPEVGRLTKEILERGKHLFLSTDGTLIRRRLHMIPPYTNFFWNVGFDGTEAVHDGRAKRPGLFLEALDGVKAAKNAGFFVVVTTTIFADSDLRDVRRLSGSTPAIPGNRLRWPWNRTTSTTQRRCGASSIRWLMKSSPKSRLDHAMWWYWPRVRFPRHRRASCAVLTRCRWLPDGPSGLLVA